MITPERASYFSAIKYDYPKDIKTQNKWFNYVGISRPKEKYVKSILLAIKHNTSNPSIKNYIDFDEVRTWKNVPFREKFLNYIRKHHGSEYGKV